MQPTFAQPFPPGLASLHGCFALETSRARIESFAKRDLYAPVLYMTKLKTEGPCKNMTSLGLELDKQCFSERLIRGVYVPPGRQSSGSSTELDATTSLSNQTGSSQSSTQTTTQLGQEQASTEELPDCDPDRATQLHGREVCDFYEGTPGQWKDFFLAECDCLKRDHVPALADVVRACRDKVASMGPVREQYNAAVAAGTFPLPPFPSSLTAEMCDALEPSDPAASPAVLMLPLEDRDYFNHLLARYLTRGLWKSQLEEYGGREPAVDSGWHPHCTYRPCKDAEDTLFHVPYGETERAKGTCRNVAECDARITTQFVRGEVTIRDNVFRVQCKGGENCKTENLVPRCSGNGFCQPDGSCDCDDGWTGPTCAVRTRPGDDDGGGGGSGGGGGGGNQKPNFPGRLKPIEPTLPGEEERSTSSAGAIVGIGLVIILLLVIVTWAVK
jgi:hypothetical protein